MRKKLIKLIEHIVVPYFAAEIADYLIENDAVIVVRCKDCKHYGTSRCAMDTYAFDVVEEGFCSYGERKETTP